MTATNTRERVERALEGIAVQFSAANDSMVTVEVSRDALHDALVRLKERAGFEQNTLVTAVDRLDAEPRFEIVYQFLSFDHNDRIRVRTRVADGDARVASCTDLWPGASYSERECFDMFGIQFEGHPDLRRLLMPDGYTHHPLRKDFPHGGIEPDRLYREWDQKRREGWQD